MKNAHASRFLVSAVVFCLAVTLPAQSRPAEALEGTPADGSAHEAESREGVVVSKGKGSLRTLVEGFDFQVGAALGHGAWSEEEPYRRTAAREFNAFTPENVMKWDCLSPERGRWNFSKPNAMVDWALKNAMAVHGHTLVWYQQLPPWLKDGTWTRQELIGVLQEHIRTVVTHYRGKVALWDVVNEALEDEGDGGGYRKTLWLRVIGPQYIEIAFRAAHEADPQALLLYNDYGVENLGAKSDAMHAMLKDLLERGVPVHGVGFQAHFKPQEVNIESFAKNLQRFADLGLRLYVTELDVRIQDGSGAQGVAEQAKAYGQIVRACLQQPACKGVTTWGFTDKHSWVPYFFKGWGAALLFDKDYQPKPAYESVREALAEHFDKKRGQR